MEKKDLEKRLELLPQGGITTKTIKPDIATDDDHNIQCFRMNGGSDLTVGDHITVTGVIKNYAGVVEFENGCTYVKVD